MGAAEAAQVLTIKAKQHARTFESQTVLLQLDLVHCPPTPRGDFTAHTAIWPVDGTLSPSSIQKNQPWQDSRQCRNYPLLQTVSKRGLCKHTSQCERLHKGEARDPGGLMIGWCRERKKVKAQFKWLLRLPFSFLGLARGKKQALPLWRLVTAKYLPSNYPQIPVLSLLRRGSAKRNKQ